HLFVKPTAPVSNQKCSRIFFKNFNTLLEYPLLGIIDMNCPTRIVRMLLLLFTLLILFPTMYYGVSIAKADSVIATIPVGSFPSGIAFNPSNGDMYVTNQAGGGINSTVSVIDSSTNRVINTITTGVRSTALAFNPIN